MDSRNTALVNASLPILFLGASAALQMISASLYLKCEPDLLMVASFFSITSGIYLLNRVLDKEDKFNNLSRWLFFNKSTLRTCFWITISLLAIFEPVVSCTFEKKSDLALYFLVIAAIGIFYSVKGIPYVLRNFQVKWISLKDIPFLKSILVCIIWGGSGMVLSAVANKINFLRPDLLLIILTFSICTLNSTVTADARDIHGDRARNIITLPVLFGEWGTFKFLACVNGCSLVLMLLLSIWGIFTPALMFFSGICIIMSCISIIPQYYKKVKLSKTMLELSVDSYIVTTAMGLIVLSLN